MILYRNIEIFDLFLLIKVKANTKRALYLIQFIQFRENDWIFFRILYK